MQRYRAILRYPAGLICLAAWLLVFALPSFSQGQDGAPPAHAVLVRAVMCEEIENLSPKNISVVFSIAYGRVCCYTEFDPVLEQTDIFHSWFNRDKLISTKRLTLRPPKWASFSQMQLREADIGPWRVEIHDQDGKRLGTLRFSITE